MDSTDASRNARRGFLSLAASREVVVNSIKVALVVGTLLVLINQAEALSRPALLVERADRILLTYLVPYCVSTFSAVKAMRKPPAVAPRS